MQVTSKQWDNYHKKNQDILCAAQMLIHQQKQYEEDHTEKKESIFDKTLVDVSLYRHNGKWKSPYHSGLYQKRKAGENCCPVFDVSLKAFIQSQKNKAYMQKVMATETKAAPKQFELNLMDINQAFEQFYEEYLKPAFFHQDKEYILDKRNEEVLWKLISYFTRQHDCPLNIKKGLCLYGDIGTGKSTIMKCLSKFTSDYDLKTRFDFVYMDDVYSDCSSKGLESLDDYKFKSCCFDDIGMRAEKNVNNYGTSINSYQELVKRQYRRFSRPTPSLSHYTTNIQYSNQDHTKQLMKVFGGRELDRFREMCNFVPLLGPSRRNY